MSKIKPPQFADRFLGWFIKGDVLEEALGDLYEYHDEMQNITPWKRNLFYWFHVFQFIRPQLVKSLIPKNQRYFWDMIGFNSKIAIRTLKNNRLVTLTSLVCIILGSLCFQLIYTWFYNEMSTDKFHAKIDRIYIGVARTNPMAELTPISLQTFFNLDYSQFPEIENKLSIHVYRKDEIKFIANQHEFTGKGLIADSTFFDFFDFKLLQGSKDLADPSSVMITQSFANRVFGKTNPIGKTVEIKCDQSGTYKVVGVLEKIPSNSSIYFDFLVPRHSQQFWRRIPLDLVLTSPHFNYTAFDKKVAFMGRESVERFPESLLSVVPFSELYFEQTVESILLNKYGSENSVYTMAFIAVMIWIITLLGFNNLQSTLQLSSAKKYGIKQVIGATKRALSSEIMLMRFYMLLIAVTVSFALFQLLFPYYTAFMEFEIDHNAWNDFLSILVVSTLFLFISTAVSIFQLNHIKSNQLVTKAVNLFRISRLQRGLVIAQYAITIVLMITTSAVFIQYNYMSNKDPGIKTDNIVSIDFFEIQSRNLNEDQLRSFEFIKHSLAQSPLVQNYSQGDMPIGSKVKVSSWSRVGEGFDYASENIISVDPSYDQLLGLKLTEGRFFSDSLDQPRQQKVVINEAARKYWQIADIQSAKLSSNTSGRQEYVFEVIGVVQDFHYQHLSNRIKPLVMLYRPYPDENFLIELAEANQDEGLAFLEDLFEQVNPTANFDYQLLTTELERQYLAEKRLGKIYFAFTLVGLLLSSICLLAFSFYEANRRTKEVGIRKVNGATAKDVFGLLSFSFVKIIVIAIFLAAPFCWFMIQKWMERFAYRATIDWWVYLLVGLFAIGTALFVTMWQTISVSQKNPIQSLRYE